MEYSLTPLGVDVGRLTNQIAEWSMDHVDEITAARADFDARALTEPVPL